MFNWKCRILPKTKNFNNKISYLLQKYVFYQNIPNRPLASFIDGTNMSKLKLKIGHFLVILVLLLLNVGGCGGQPLSSKFILKVKTRMAIPKEHVHITFLTPWIVFVGFLGFQSMTLCCKTPCM